MFSNLDMVSVSTNVKRKKKKKHCIVNLVRKRLSLFKSIIRQCFSIINLILSLNEPFNILH